MTIVSMDDERLHRLASRYGLAYACLQEFARELGYAEDKGRAYAVSQLTDELKAAYDKAHEDAKQQYRWHLIHIECLRGAAKSVGIALAQLDQLEENMKKKDIK